MDLRKYKIDRYEGGDGFSVWKWKMERVFAVEKLTKVVKGEVAASEDQSNLFDFLMSQSLGDSELLHIMDLGTPNEKWEYLATVHQQKSADSVQDLQSKFFNLQYEDESMADFLARVKYLVKSLKDFESPIEDSMVINMILSRLPKDYEMWSVSWSHSHVESKDRTMAKLTSGLLGEEARLKLKNPTIADKGKALITGKHDQPTSSNRHGNKSGDGKKFNGSCRYCNKFGHKRADCRKLKKDQKDGKGNGDGFSENGSNNHVKASALVLEVGSDKSLEWIADSGSTHHVCPVRSWFKDMKASAVKYITVANGKNVEVKGVGTIEVLSNGSTLPIQDVLFVPDVKHSLLSLPSVDKKGHQVKLEKGKCVIKRNDGYLLATGSLHGQLYRMDFNPVNGEAHAAAPLELLHQRYGHVNMRKVTTITGRKVTKDGRFVCEPCIKGKSSRKPFKTNRKRERKDDVGKLVHADLNGPMQVNSVSGARYFLLLKDDYSGLRFAYFMGKKSMVPAAIEKFLSDWKAVTRKPIVALRTDNGTEFTCRETQKLLKGIVHETSTPHVPQQNGFIERSMRTVPEMARTMMIGTDVPKYLWAEAVNAAIHILNRMPLKELDKSPLEIVTGK